MYQNYVLVVNSLSGGTGACWHVLSDCRIHKLTDSPTTLNVTCQNIYIRLCGEDEGICLVYSQIPAGALQISLRARKHGNCGTKSPGHVPIATYVNISCTKIQSLAVIMPYIKCHNNMYWVHYYLSYILMTCPSVYNMQIVYFLQMTPRYHYCSSHDMTQLHRSIEIDLAYISDWFYANKLSLNVAKSNFVLFSRSNSNREIVSLQLGNQVIERTKNAKFLWIYIDDKLDLSIHINYIKSKLSSGVYALNAVKHSLSTQTLNTLYYSMGIMDEQHTSFNTQVYLESASWGLITTNHTTLHNIHVESASRGAALNQLPRETLPRRASFPCNTPPPPGTRESPDKPVTASGNPLQLVWSSLLYGLGIFWVAQKGGRPQWLIFVSMTLGRTCRPRIALPRGISVWDMWSLN